jgi:hypothetical protein
MMVVQRSHHRTVDISPLQGEAWEAWNASYHAEINREAHRALGRALYELDVHERITSLLAQLDEQNALLDSLLAG